MKRPIILWFSLAIWVVLFGVWIWQSESYPDTIYEYRQSGEVLGQYDDRVAGLEVEAVPVYEPNNPAWVKFIRRWSLIILFILAIYIIYVEVDFREKRNKLYLEAFWKEHDPELKRIIAESKGIDNPLEVLAKFKSAVKEKSKKE
jgi:hypothetical protein